MLWACVNHIEEGECFSFGTNLHEELVCAQGLSLHGSWPLRVLHKKGVVLIFFLEKRERSFMADGFVLVERGWAGFFGSTMRIVLGRVAQF